MQTFRALHMSGKNLVLSIQERQCCTHEFVCPVVTKGAKTSLIPKFQSKLYSAFFIVTTQLLLPACRMHMHDSAASVTFPRRESIIAPEIKSTNLYHKWCWKCYPYTRTNSLYRVNGVEFTQWSYSWGTYNIYFRTFPFNSSSVGYGGFFL
jgi:hypothetical protein